jgi:hypothetical protein
MARRRLGKPLALPRFNHFGLNVLSLTKLTEIIGKIEKTLISLISNNLGAQTILDFFDTKRRRRLCGTKQNKKQDRCGCLWFWLVARLRAFRPSCRVAFREGKAES